MSPAIRAQGLFFAHGALPVLEDVDLEIAEGSFVSIVGPNGGGKSTLLMLVLGLLRPTRGRLEVLGRSPAAVRDQIGYMPQSQRLDPSFPITVEEVVGLGHASARLPLGFARRGRRQAVDTALRQVNCEHLRSRSFAALSGGQRQLVLIARALVSAPRILLLDEPTANLDPAVEEAFYALLQELRGEITICLVSHDVGLVSEQSEQVVCVNRKVDVHPAHEISTEIIQGMFGGGGALLVDHGHAHHAHTQRGEPHP